MQQADPVDGGRKTSRAALSADRLAVSLLPAMYPVHRFAAPVWLVTALACTLFVGMAARVHSRPGTGLGAWTGNLALWRVEQMPGGTVTTRGDALVINDEGGCTVWFKRELVAPVEITYEVTTVSRGGPNDRVSDVNCFWMATDPNTPDGQPAIRSGRFADYDTLRTYYVGMGGHTNTATRFRRYEGSGNKPLLPEHDLSDPRFLLQPNRTYRIRLVARDGVAEYWRDGEKIFSFTDPQPLTRGWFGFRTVKSHLEFRALQVKDASTR